MIHGTLAVSTRGDVAASKLAVVIAAALRRTENRARYRRVLDAVLADDGARDVILHRLGTGHMHDTRRIDTARPKPGPVEGFEDLTWLLSSNYANRGLALLMLDEALWLYRTIGALERPQVAELGRAKGGTTFLMAAAGAHVLSLDNGALEESARARHSGMDVSYAEALRRTLAGAELADRVELVNADATTYAPPPAAFDLVYIDIPIRGDRGMPLFDRWWQALRPGGRLVLRDGREPRMPGAIALVDALRRRPDVAFEEPAPGLFVVVVTA